MGHVKSYYHNKRRKVHPADIPKQVWPESEHLVDTIAESVGSKKPRNSNGLKKTHPEQRYS